MGSCYPFNSEPPTLVEALKVTFVWYFFAIILKSLNIQVMLFLIVIPIFTFFHYLSYDFIFVCLLACFPGFQFSLLLTQGTGIELGKFKKIAVPEGLEEEFYFNLSR